MLLFLSILTVLSRVLSADDGRSAPSGVGHGERVGQAVPDGAARSHGASYAIGNRGAGEGAHQGEGLPATQRWVKLGYHINLS